MQSQQFLSELIIRYHPPGVGAWFSRLAVQTTILSSSVRFPAVHCAFEQDGSFLAVSIHPNDERDSPLYFEGPNFSQRWISQRIPLIPGPDCWSDPLESLSSLPTEYQKIEPISLINNLSYWPTKGMKGGIDSSRIRTQKVGNPGKYCNKN